MPNNDTESLIQRVLRENIDQLELIGHSDVHIGTDFEASFHWYGNEVFLCREHHEQIHTAAQARVSTNTPLRIEELERARREIEHQSQIQARIANIMLNAMPRMIVTGDAINVEMFDTLKAKKLTRKQKKIRKLKAQGKMDKLIKMLEKEKDPKIVDEIQDYILEQVSEDERPKKREIVGQMHLDTTPHDLISSLYEAYGLAVQTPRHPIIPDVTTWWGDTDEEDIQRQT